MGTHDIRHKFHNKEAWSKMSVADRKDAMLQCFAEFTEDHGESCPGGCPVRAEEHCYNYAGEEDKNGDWQLAHEGGCQQCLADRLNDIGEWA